MGQVRRRTRVHPVRFNLRDTAMFRIGYHAGFRIPTVDMVLPLVKEISGMVVWWDDMHMQPSVR